jgi:hypothetical protein
MRFPDCQRWKTLLDLITHNYLNHAEPKGECDMAKERTNRTDKRQQRKNPDRGGPNRRATDYIIRHAKKKGHVKTERIPKTLISESVEQAIANMVQTGSNVIEEQIRAGQAAAERLRQGIANSRQLNSDINLLIENLLATTKDVGTTWLELISIIVRAIGAQPPHGGGGTPHTPPHGSGTVTKKGTSGKAVTVSTFTPGDADIVGVPPQIVVKGARATSVSLNLHPSTAEFAPLALELFAKDRRYSLSSVKFSQSSDDPPRSVLTVTVPDNQPTGIYTGAVVDSTTNEAGGTLSVTVGG